jgi:adenylylsulfate kinase
MADSYPYPTQYTDAPFVSGAAPQQRAGVVWLSGLSGAGKSTVAAALNAVLQGAGLRTAMLDGDQLRRGLCRDLQYGAADRHENLRRAGEVCKLFTDLGLIVIAAFVSPAQADRDMVHALAGADFFEVYCDAPLSVCEARDVKGLYARARSGQLPDFTGVSAPYEVPLRPALALDTAGLPVRHNVARIVALLAAHRIIPEHIARAG